MSHGIHRSIVHWPHIREAGTAGHSWHVQCPWIVIKPGGGELNIPIGQLNKVRLKKSRKVLKAPDFTRVGHKLLLTGQGKNHSRTKSKEPVGMLFASSLYCVSLLPRSYFPVCKMGMLNGAGLVPVARLKRQTECVRLLKQAVLAWKREEF